MSTPTTPSSSPILTASTPPTSPSSTSSPSPPDRHTYLRLATTLPALNRSLLRALNLAIAYHPVGSRQHRALTIEAAKVEREIEQAMRPKVVTPKPKVKEVSYAGWEHRYPNFGKNDPPVFAPTKTKTTTTTTTTTTAKANKKRGAEAAELDKGGVEGREGGGKRVRKMTEKAKEMAADLGVEKGEKKARKGAVGKKGRKVVA